MSPGVTNMIEPTYAAPLVERPAATSNKGAQRVNRPSLFVPSVLSTVRLLALLALGIMLAGIGCTEVVYDYSKEVDPRTREFVIGVADVVRINVWKNPELSTEATVRPDGTVTMPLIGDLSAAGRTPTQLRQEVTRRLSEFVKDENATVTVAITAINSYRYTVSGNFEKPGTFSSKYYVTVTEAAAMAGGLNKYANPKKVFILRPQISAGHAAAEIRRIPLDFEAVSAGRRPDGNLVLVTGDTLLAE
jgi:polysaccharide biosynthesis/export protein